MDFYTETNNRFFYLISEEFFFDQFQHYYPNTMTPKEKQIFQSKTGMSVEDFYKKYNSIRQGINPKLKPLDSIEWILPQLDGRTTDEFFKDLENQLRGRASEKSKNKRNSDLTKQGWGLHPVPKFVEAKEFDINDILQKNIVGFIDPATGKGYYSNSVKGDPGFLYHGLIAEKICDLLNIKYDTPEVLDDNPADQLRKTPDEIPELRKKLGWTHGFGEDLRNLKNSAYNILLRKRFIRFFGGENLEKGGAQGHELDAYEGDVSLAKDLQSVLKWADNIVCEFQDDSHVAVIQKFLTNADKKIKAEYSILAENIKTKKSVNCLVIDFLRQGMKAPSLTDTNDPKLDQARKFLYAQRSDYNYGDDGEDN